MPGIKLAKLPDRTPIKMTLTIGSELHQALKDYAGLYNAAYCAEEALADLIPFMLEAFLQSDKGFVRATRK